ncbi:MAG: YicC/YloC family endoribonuclease [Cocleimonas sp.]
MIKSMTAFARDETKLENIELCWEIRTVNHRHLDINLHIPDALMAHEHGLKDIIRKRIGRGRFEATLSIQSSLGKHSQTIQLDEEKAKNLLAASQTVEALSANISGLTAMEILQWPGVIKDTQNTYEDYSAQAKTLLESALDTLVSMREIEGTRLLAMITSRCDKVLKIIEVVKSRRVEVIQALREKVLNKLSELEITTDNNRLEQELVYQAQRLDVDEELDRLGAHIEEVNAVLKRNEPIGRRLDFLMQELNREANTLASKSNDVETTKSAVELKILIEQMREQCLNIE